MHQHGKVLAILGVGLQSALVLCEIMGISQLILAFEQTAAADSAGPESLVAGVQQAQVFGNTGLMLGIIGIGLILFSVFRLRYRARWFYGVLWPCACVWLLMFPIGTALGIAMMLYLVKHKAEFYGPPLGPLFQSTAARF